MVCSTLSSIGSCTWNASCFLQDHQWAGEGEIGKNGLKAHCFYWSRATFSWLSIPPVVISIQSSEIVNSDSFWRFSYCFYETDFWSFLLHHSHWCHSSLFYLWKWWMFTEDILGWIFQKHCFVSGYCLRNFPCTLISLIHCASLMNVKE